jgi:hypothetical protein
VLEAPAVFLPEAARYRRRADPSKLKENAEQLFGGTARIKGAETTTQPIAYEPAEQVPTLVQNPKNVDFVPNDQPDSSPEMWAGGDDTYGLDLPIVQTEKLPVIEEEQPIENPPPDTPTISDLRAALAMVNELVVSLGDDVVLHLENNRIYAKRKIVRYVDLE